VIYENEVGGLILALHRAAHATAHAVTARQAQFALTPSEQNVLAVLADVTARTVGAIAAATGTKSSTLTSVLDRLENRGYMTREADLTDRRAVLINLTGPGRQAAAAVSAAIADLEQSALAGLSKQQLSGFFAVTGALTEATR
jgi:MarR family transcriptional regulator, organic hydroperoxide resistance regulator